MAFTIYRSSDASAPTLSGTAGDLVNLLDKCLVAGYGAKTAAGWTKPYAGTNKAAFRQGSGSNQFYLRVDDNGPGAGTGREARVVGYESMSDVDTGTNPFPTAAQAASGQFVRKSAAADATTRTWVVVADARTFYVFVQTGDSAGVYFGWMFGEFYSVVSGDSYRTMLIARTSENSASASVDRLDVITGSIATITGHYVARAHTGTGTSLLAGKHGDMVKSNNSSALNGVLPYPNPGDAAVYISPLWVHDPTTSPVNSVRGRLRGLHHWLHSISGVADGDTFTGTGAMAGRTFLILKTSGNSGLYVIETSDTLETN